MQWDCRLSTGLPPAANYVACDSRRRICSEHETGTEELFETSRIITLSHYGLVTVRYEAHLRRGHNDQLRQSHQCSETMLTGESRFHISTFIGLNPGPPHEGKQTDDPLDQWDCVWIQWDCRLSTRSFKNWFFCQGSRSYSTHLVTYRLFLYVNKSK
jgi:hypothetical protein